MTSDQSSSVPVSSAPVSVPIRTSPEPSLSEIDSEADSDHKDDATGLDAPNPSPPVLVAEDLPVTPSEDFRSYRDLICKMAASHPSGR